MINPALKNRHGYTLVELLVVIAILAILFVLSTIGFQRYRSYADRNVSMGNLRTMQLSNALYAQENNGRYVPMEQYNSSGGRENEWYANRVFLSYVTGGEIGPNTPSPIVYPQSILDPAAVRAKGRLWNHIFASYGYVQEGMPAVGSPPRPNAIRGFRASQVTDPSRSAAFITATDWKLTYNSRFNWVNDERPDSEKEGKSTDQRIAFRYDGRAVVAYYDGSVRMITPEDLRAIDSQGGNRHAFWNAAGN